MNKTVKRVAYSEIKNVLSKILENYGFNSERADILAGIFADNNLYGKDSHGLNRFPVFINSIEKELVDVNAVPEKVKKFQAFEQWDGKLGAGPLNAVICADRTMALADENGIGCLALRNTNHWMRGGTYGWRAAERGYFFICWSNTTPNMPAWGSDEPRLGNNPLIIAIPKKNGPVVLDMAMSQYSYGSLEVHSKNNEDLSFEGGYDEKGKLTTNPDDILTTQRTLPAGLWKGAGLALVLDLMAAFLSDGKSSKAIGDQQDEYGLSQVFIAIKSDVVGSTDALNKIVEEIISDYHQSKKVEDNDIYYPGERSMNAFKDRKENGIPVNISFWNEIKEMAPGTS